MAQLNDLLVLGNTNLVGKVSGVEPEKIGAYPSDTLLSGAVLTDYNTLTNGAWKVRSGSSNAPTTYAATVFHKDWDINFATQMAFNNDTTISFRFKTGGTWHDWTSYFLPLSGGSLTGLLKANKNIQIINTNPWILLNDSDANYNFYVQVSGNTLALGNTWNKSVLIDPVGKMTIQSETTIANNTPAKLVFSVKQTDNNITTASGMISYYDDHDAQSYGGTMVIHSAGNMVIGSGEAPNSCYNTDLKGNTGENTYIVSDSNIYFYTNCNTYSSKKTGVYINTAGVLYGAAWNDYAEYRNQKEEIEPGYCAAAVNDGKLIKTTERLQACDGIVSDTFGFTIGKTDICQTPLAVSGRVLAYFEGNREDYQAGDAVGAGPNGKVVKMTREEIKEYPDKIIGHVSEIPEYEFWGANNIKVNNRIWIKIH